MRGTQELLPSYAPENNHYIINGTFYSLVPLGSTPELPAETCKEIKASEGEAESKKYWLSTI